MYWFSDHGPVRSDTRVDPVYCYDELIISYSQTRDILKTATATFAVPGHLDGFRHVLLLGGRLLGHWRAHADAGGVRVETRTSRSLGAEETAALADAVGRYRQFASPP